MFDTSESLHKDNKKLEIRKPKSLYDFCKERAEFYDKMDTKIYNEDYIKLCSFLFKKLAEMIEEDRKIEKLEIMDGKLLIELFDDNRIVRLYYAYNGSHASDEIKCNDAIYVMDFDIYLTGFAELIFSIHGKQFFSSHYYGRVPNEIKGYE